MERKDIDMLPAGDLKSPFNPDTVHWCVGASVVGAFTSAVRVCLCVCVEIIESK